jgi:hypothetical protein
MESVKENNLWEELKKVKWNDEYINNIPKNKQITASYDEKYIIFYQAYNDKIAEFAVKNQQFKGCPEFSTTRMTWIKPNFLWMMYRSSWATSINQERILAIWLERKDFENEILKNSVLSSYDDSCTFYSNKDEWSKALNSSDARVQWDPYHSFKGNKIPNVTRCIQIGIRKKLNEKFAVNKNNVTNEGESGMLVFIEDVTNFVKQQSENYKKFDVYLPEERIYEISDNEINKKIGLN